MNFLKHHKKKIFIKLTPENCLESVKRDGLLLQYVKKQTPEIWQR